MPTKLTQDEAFEMIDRAAAALAEHFEAVEILASVRLDGDNAGTRSVYGGRGNWFARQGMAHDFISREQANEVSDQIAKKINPDEGEDGWKKV